MTIKDETRASCKRGRRAAPVSADKTKGETAVVDTGTNAITTDAAALMSAPPPEQYAIAGGEEAVGVANSTGTAVENCPLGISDTDSVPAIEPQRLVPSDKEPACSTTMENTTAGVALAAERPHAAVDEMGESLTVADAGDRTIPMIGLDAKPDNTTSTSRPGHEASKGPHVVAAEGSVAPLSPNRATPKIPTGKNVMIAALVSRPEGAGLGELASMTGWQRHTVRAALTRLRQAGFAVELRTEEDGRRTYHHVAGAEASS